ncbi:NADH-quinone oxidoreductase subunit M [Candidatus Sulfurimonas marisnigri]|uniref:NADH-quinone oxidoreductase subunit M n=1 Tax=Candidatus Sulfurimonas marisnigri TaxID=2740405 RepID=A0A7S7LZI9_9BACT|nr:NADH-quinone oxidoreductase subunit M [Candidatus Sulfurimonas marisnigri]QOY54332.1 NADH-quinone oxidoreductase subunit M [Candidatus Sulfurimonas marisnigri]
MSTLSIIIFSPIIAALFLFFTRPNIAIVKIVYMVVTLSVLYLAVGLYIDFDPAKSMQFIEYHPWISEYGINYHVGVDGVSLGIVMMNAIIMPLVTLALHKLRDKNGYWINLLFVQGGIMGAVLSLDLMLFYLFWELMLLPIFFMLGLFGYGKKNYVAMKFNMYTIFGSLMMLIAILYIAVQYKEQFGTYSFDLNELKYLTLSSSESLLVFSGFMLAFAIKIPIFPFHTWLSDTYRSAPTGIVIVMSALMAKLGVYAIWRFLFTLFNETSHAVAPYFIGIGLFGLIYFGFSAMTQTHIKRMFAFSSASHLSLIVVGFFIYDVYGLIGSSYLIVAHALSSAALFLMVGIMFERTRAYRIDDLGGIARVAPKFALLFVFFSLSIVGVPLTAGFVAEVLIILGAFKYNIYIGLLTTTTILIAMLFMFKTISKVLYGELSESTKDFKDLRLHELVALVPLALLILVMGIFPNYFIKKIEPTAESYSQKIGVIYND